MTVIARDIKSAEAAVFDLVVIGGGVYGAFLTLEASRRGLRPLLLEREDYGCGVSANSLRIIHGGLRYLQSLDIVRHRESVRERSWFLRSFPELIRPLTCVMPLYNAGLRRPRIMRTAMRLNDLLSRRRNEDLPPDRSIPGGFLVDASETLRLVPAVDRNVLRASAVWHDAVMLAPQRVIMESLRRAASLGAVCLNYMEAADLVVHDNRVRAVIGIDRETGRHCEFVAPVVVNCAGPWSSGVASRLAGSAVTLSHASLAYNVVFARPPLFEGGLAVTPQFRRGSTYFLLPRNGRLVAGTVHAAWTGSVDRPALEGAALDAFLDSLNDCVPGLNLTHDEVAHIDAGYLPARSFGSSRLATRPAFHDHGADGGPYGLFSVCGVKFTTARLVAERALRAVFGPALRETGDPADDCVPSVRPLADFTGFSVCEHARPAEVGERLKPLIDEECAVHLDDLLLRRTTWADEPCDPRPIAECVSRQFGWSGERCRSELKRLAVQCRRSGMVRGYPTQAESTPSPAGASERRARLNA